ncbi:MAG TPA: alpha-L-arabinofuranosidase C-terminal domain-containing protein [Ferruginibacter sp.]|nr:alpha-L-arabinofuranosidase C-terminal domain-containing protein [Ferruginibacter sp.]HMP20448.1 alpha-L-arabinofuranosidase C-terminal domain-containing protein [Ferruginibacter sp.]
MHLKKLFATAVAVSIVLLNVAAQGSKKLVIKAASPIANIQPTMWGVFFEDINLGADGGIYAELVKNRSFEFFKPLMGWKLEQQPFNEGAVMVLNRQGTSLSNPRFLRVAANNAVKGSLSLTNEGFRGMGIKNGLRYDLSFMYRQPAAGLRVHAELLNSKNEVIGNTVVTPAATGEAWEKVSVSFKAIATEMKGRLRLWFEGTGAIDLDMVSLFPEDTWRKRPGGLRADMVQLLADMKPGFLRFPGGCIVEGFDLGNRYQWKKTIGPVEDRQVMINRWNIEFAHRPAPDYFQTFGLGFFEYFQLAEDIGAEPLPILNCGMACQFNSAEFVPLDQLDPYVQDALDLIEFANGSVQTKWGRIRADMGHPAPFNLKLLGVGNENWGPQYIERLKIFQKAIKAQYPGIKLITSAGTDPDGERFDLLNTELRKMNVDFIDEHYYRRPEWFLSNARRYDNYPRNGSKVFAGEYAAHYETNGVVYKPNNWFTALSEAAFLTGLERNADVVHMASYAPLFAHEDGWQWTPDLIWVNNLQAYGTTDYQVQKLFSLNKGSKVVPINLNKDVVAGQDSLYASATVDETTKELLVKIVNASAISQSCNIVIEGKKPATSGKLLLLQTNNLAEMNSFTQPNLVAPNESLIEAKGKNMAYEALPYSVGVIRIKIL